MRMAEGMMYIRRLWRSRWVVLVSAVWLQSLAGIGYVYGSLSPIIKSSLKYNQRQINTLGVAKDIGDALGLIGSSLSEVWPPWAIILLGALQNFVGYGCLWLVVSHKLPPMPFWMILIIVGVGTNGETNFNTISLVSCVKNFPRNRGPIVGILKGFTGLCGAILTQYYAAIFAPDQAAFILIVAVLPTMVAIALMFVIRPVGGSKESDPSTDTHFALLYGMCLVLAAYLLGVILLQDFVDVKKTVSLVFTAILVAIMVSPLAIPLYESFNFAVRHEELVALLKHTASPLLEEGTDTVETQGYERQDSSQNWRDALLSEVEDEKPREVDFLPERERRKRLAQLQARLVHAAAEGAVRVRTKLGPRRGENFTLMQAMIKADFWLLFFSLVFGAGSGLTVIDNLGQISQSRGYENSHVFVSIISIWNFLGRIGGGYISELVARDYAYPRPLTMAAAQIIMSVGHVIATLSWSGCLYAGTLLVGVGYGAHWAIIPATVSEIFGLKNFGALYNFFIMANPVGSLIFSGVIAGTLYDWEAERQVTSPGHSSSLQDGSLVCYGQACFFYTFLILSGLCIVAAILSMIVVYRTKLVYYNLYSKNSSSTLSLVKDQSKKTSSSGTSRAK